MRVNGSNETGALNSFCTHQLHGFARKHGFVRGTYSDKNCGGGEEMAL
jgi:hypothetical protein